MRGEWTDVYDKHPDSPRRMFVTREGLRYTVEQHALLVLMQRLEKKIDEIAPPRPDRKLSDIARELRDNYPAVDVTTAVFADLAGVACCVIPQDRVIAMTDHVEALVKALESISKQMTMGELIAEYGEDYLGDPESAYDAIIMIARDALRPVGQARGSS